MKYLQLGIGNAKLKNDVVIVDLPAGFTCPYSKDCGDKVNPKTGKMIFNPKAKFRCFAATSELISPAARVKRWRNYNLIRKCDTSKEIAELIAASFNANLKAQNAAKVRIHSSGDFFNQKYFNAWLIFAKAMPEKTFYAYTKSLKFWVAKLNEIPENFHLIASKGGKNDSLIEKHNLKNVEVVFSEEEAKAKNIEIDHDDSHCYDRKCKKFALLLHGTQAKNSRAMDAIMKMRKDGIMGYKRGKVGDGRRMNVAA